MDNFDNLVIRNKIIDILTDQNEINDKNNDMNEIVEKIKMFTSNLEIFSVNLINLIEKFSNASKPQITNIPNSQMDQNISYSEYIKLSLPLYVIYFLKKSSNCAIKLPACISITNYDNLVQEEKYKSLRKCHQIILMWKSIGDGCYIILSIILADINEIDFIQKRYFISYVGGTNITECEYNWNAYNKTNIDKLITDKRIMTLRDAVNKLITIDNYDEIK
jgi:hypothetical protein